mgnify:CR=1 FL=1
MNEFLPPEAIEHMKVELEGVKPVKTYEELADLCEGSESLESLLKSFKDYAVRYARDVWSMQEFLDKGGLDSEYGAENFKEIDQARTRLHNALIDSIAILSRQLAREGRDNEWVRDLTDGTSLNRAACGSFAILLVYELALKGAST